MAGTISESQRERCAANQSRSLCSARSRRKARPPCGNPSNAIGWFSARAIAQQVEVILLAARLLRLLDRDPADDAVLVDDERASFGVPGLAEEDAVLLRHVPLGVEIGEQRRAQSLVALERAQAPPVVHGYADHRRVLSLVLHPAGPDLFQLLRTDGREGGGEEDDDDVAAAKAGKAGGLALLVEQLEIRGDVADLKHGSLPWMRASFAGFGRARKCAAVGRAALLQFTTPSAVLVAWAGRRIFACEAVERLLASGLPRQPRSRNFPVGGTSMPSDAKTLLRIGYGLVPIVAGADKFTNLLVDWDRYLSPKVERRLPVDGRTFMRLVGVVEIAAGLLVLRRPRVGGAVVSAWLAAIAGNLLSMGKYLDIAARDALLAVGAAALAMMPESSQATQKPRIPARRMRMDPVGTIPRSVH